MGRTPQVTPPASTTSSAMTSTFVSGHSGPGQESAIRCHRPARIKPPQTGLVHEPRASLAALRVGGQGDARVGTERRRPRRRTAPTFLLCYPGSPRFGEAPVALANQFATLTTMSITRRFCVSATVHYSVAIPMGRRRVALRPIRRARSNRRPGGSSPRDRRGRASRDRPRLTSPASPPRSCGIDGHQHEPEQTRRVPDSVAGAPDWRPARHLKQHYERWSPRDRAAIRTTCSLLDPRTGARPVGRPLGSRRYRRRNTSGVSYGAESEPPVARLAPGQWPGCRRPATVHPPEAWRSEMGERSWSGAVRHRWPGADRAIKTRIDGVELSPIKAVELEASRLPDVVSLAQGIPSFDTPEPIKRFVQERMSRGRPAPATRSLRGCRGCARRIAEALRRDGMPYDPDGEILVTAGSIEAIAASLLALVEPGDEVLVVSPTYASYIPAIRLAGAVPRFVPLAEDANFDLDPEAIARRRRAAGPAPSSSATRTTRPGRSSRPSRRGGCWRSPSARTSWSSPTRSTRISSTATPASTARRLETWARDSGPARLLIL